MSKEKKSGNYYDKIPNFQDQEKSRLVQQVSRGLGIFVIIVLSITFYFLFLHVTDLYQIFSKVTGILEPIIYGLVIAYLLNPLLKRIEQGIYILLEGKCEITPEVKKVVRMIGIIISLCVFILIIFLLIYLIIPELWESIEKLIVTLPTQLSALATSLSNREIENETLLMIVETFGGEAYTYAMQWLQTELLPQVNSLMSNVTFGVLAVLNGVFNFILGVIISIYVLVMKEVFQGQWKKSIYALLPTKSANMTLHIMKKSHQIFGGFIIGKIIDSMIIGIITFIVLYIMKMPYTLLVSVIIGVTNVIPYFGPFIGAIPCAILILIQNPVQGIYFIIYILVIQQIDGNIIGPKILGDSTGLSSFWVIFSILLFGGIFGFVGMVIGVPTFAVIYYLVSSFINHKLTMKKLPTETQGYDEMSYVDDVTGEFIPSDSQNHAWVKKEDEEEKIEQLGGSSDADSSTE